jgi:propanol-preferring alcohol dehydrogenase
VAPGGHVAIVGMAGGTFPMRRGGVPMETSVVISNWGTRAELAEVVALARAGSIRLEVEPVPLSDVVAAYGRLERGEVHGRVVAVPDGGDAA